MPLGKAAATKRCTRFQTPTPVSPAVSRLTVTGVHGSGTPPVESARAACEDFVRTLPPTVVNHERIQLMLAKLVLARGDYPAVRKILQREFGTIREGELRLSELWFASWIQEAAKRQGRDLTEPEKQAVRGL